MRVRLVRNRTRIDHNGVGRCSNLSSKEEWETFYTPVFVFSRACGFHMNTITVANCLYTEAT